MCTVKIAPKIERYWLCVLYVYNSIRELCWNKSLHCKSEWQMNCGKKERYTLAAMFSGNWNCGRYISHPMLLQSQKVSSSAQLENKLLASPYTCTNLQSGITKGKEMLHEAHLIQSESLQTWGWRTGMKIFTCGRNFWVLQETECSSHL